MSDFLLPRFTRRVESVPRPPSPLLLPPSAEFTYVQDGLSVTCQSQSVDPDGTILQHTWDFGDTPVLPVAQFSATPNGRTITFTDESTVTPPGTIVAWFWEFGDGTTSTTQHPVKTYATAGAYNVSLRVTDNNGNQSLARQQVVHVQGTGILIGTYSYFTGPSSHETIGTQYVRCGGGSCPPNQVIERIAYCRQQGLYLWPAFAGGANTNYLTNGNFDFEKWKARWNLTNTAAIKKAVADAVTDGIIPAAILLDEPHVTKWGTTFQNYPGGGKKLVDAMATFSKSIHPTLPVGPTQQADNWTTQSYTVVDFTSTQYTHRQGDIDAYITFAKSIGTRDGHHIVFALNLLDGGIKGRPCGDDTGGTGTYGENCRVTAAQLETWGKKLGENTRGVFQSWRHDAAFFGRADVQTAFANIAAYLSPLSRLSLKRGT